MPLSADGAEANVPYLVEVNIRCLPMDSDGNILPNTTVVTRDKIMLRGRDILALQDLILKFKENYGLR